MSEKLKVLAISSHPDDETVFMGGTLAKCGELGASTHLLVLTNGERGKIAVSNREQGLIGYREIGDNERLAYVESRKQECSRASDILGIQEVEFLGIPDQEISSTHLPLVREHILKNNPHVILSFNEAGTTAHPDHSWTGLLAYYAIQSILTEHTASNYLDRLNFLSLLMYTMPTANELLEKHAELITIPEDRMDINVERVIDKKKQAVGCYVTQSHLIQFFLSVGILDVPTESYVQRISKNNDNIHTERIPRDESGYIVSSSDFYSEIVSRNKMVLELLES